MRLGLLPANRNAGGVFQVSLSMIESLVPGQPDELVLVHNKNGELPLSELRRAGWETAELPAASHARFRLLRAAARRAGLRRSAGPMYPEPDNVQRDVPLDEWFAQLGVDLMLYPVPTTSAFEIDVPYVAAVHDLQHVLQPKFPEVSADGQAETREYLFRNLIRSAVTVVVDSETGKEDVLASYGEYIDADRVQVLPFAPPGYLFDPPPTTRDVRAAYDLPERYLFYPAQFWPHKNHARLIEAVALLRERGLDVTLVLCGVHDGSLRERTHAEVLQLISRHGLSDHVRLLGYVSDDDMRALYAGAVALTMPTFFGPTNIPVLEAWAAGCPVVTSDLRGIREQVGDAAVLADPRSVEDLADAIARVWTNDTLRSALVEAGSVRLRAFTPEAYRRRLHEILDDARERVRNGERGNRLWRTPSRITSN